jgi:hypothetical protein
MDERKPSYENLGRIDYPKVEQDSPLPPLTRDAVRSEARAGLEEIRDFITTDEFITVLGELYDHAPRTGTPSSGRSCSTMLSCGPATSRSRRG